MKTDKELFEQGPPLRYDQTMLFSYAANCMRKFYWFWRGVDYGIKPAYFITGQAFQESLDCFYSYGGKEEVLDLCHERIASIWEQTNAIPGGNDTPERNHELIRLYASGYPQPEPFEVITLNGAAGPTTELGFAFPLRETEFFLAGAIDGYLSWRNYGLLVLENKTTGGILGEKFLAQWGFSMQVTMYLWALHQMLENVFGTLMNLATKKITQATLKAWEDEGVVPEGIFSRTLEKRSPRQLEEFEESCLFYINQISSQWKNRNSWLWPKTGNIVECVGGPGKSPCPYRVLCSQDMFPWEIEDPIELARGTLAWREREWKPWERGE